MNGKSDIKPSYKIFMTNGEQTSQNNRKPKSGLASLSQRVTFFLESIFYRCASTRSDAM